MVWHVVGFKEVPSQRTMISPGHGIEKYSSKSEYADTKKQGSTLIREVNANCLNIELL